MTLLAGSSPLREAAEFKLRAVTGQANSWRTREECFAKELYSIEFL